MKEEGGEIKIRFFNYRKIEWNCVIFCEKLSISPISKLNVNLNFQKWITCWEDFRNFEKNIFCFPHSTSTCKFDHYYLLEIWVSFWRFYLNFGEIPPYLTLKYISKMKFVLHMGDLIQKMTFFIMFFSISPTCSYFFIQKLRQNEVIYCENDNEKFFKNWKNHEIFS